MSSDESSKAGSTGEVQEDFAAMLDASEATPRPRVAVGDVVRGRVVAVGQSAAFVEIGGKAEASIDLAELRDPATGAVQVAVGDEIEATVVNDSGGAIVLTRALGRGGHAAAELEQAQAHGIPVDGLVTAENKGGFEVQIGTVRAFCPGSQIDLRRGGTRLPASAYIGQRFRFRVLKVENHGRNVVVSRRELLAAEAADEAERTWATLHVGAVVRGTVRSLRDFGAFVDLGGVEGLIPMSELAYARVNHPGDVLTVDQPVDVQVIRIEEQPAGDRPARRLVALSLKALATDPWTTVAERFPVGSTVRGTVRRVEAFGAFVEVMPGVEGLVHISKLALDRRLSHARQAVSVGQEVDVSVMGIDLPQRRLSLSMVEQARNARDAQVVSERAEQDATVAKMNERRGLGTLGDLFAASKQKRS